jgi:hypothetical protein
MRRGRRSMSGRTRRRRRHEVPIRPAKADARKKHHHEFTEENYRGHGSILDW